MRASVLKLQPYDALIEQYDPGSRASQITPVFEELKAFLTPFIPLALETQAQRLARHPRKAFSARFPIARQKALGETMMKAVGALTSIMAGSTCHIIPFAVACRATCA